MSEASAYFILSQLNSLMTGGLRLCLDFLALGALAGLLSLRWQKWLPLGRYFSAWLLSLAVLALGAALGMQVLLPQPNPFVQQGLLLAACLIPAALLLLGLQSLALWLRPGFRLAVALLGLVCLACCLLQPAFSRSNQILLSCLLDLPLAVALAFFPFGLLPELRGRFKTAFHSLWLLAAPVSLLIHSLWLWPRLAAIPQQGEFFPFISLYDWFLFAVMILYLGNLYIDYWLKLGNRRSYLALSWNYLTLVVTVLCLWLNANIFDTLAL